MGNSRVWRQSLPLIWTDKRSAIVQDEARHIPNLEQQKAWERICLFCMTLTMGVQCRIPHQHPTPGCGVARHVLALLTAALSRQWQQSAKLKWIPECFSWAVCWFSLFLEEKYDNLVLLLRWIKTKGSLQDFLSEQKLCPACTTV